MAITYYDILGVDPDVDDAALKRGYKLRAQLLHPDRHVGASPEVLAAAARAMSDVNHAWAVLGDPASRRLYDMSISVEPQPAAPQPVARPTAARANTKGWVLDVAQPVERFIAHA